MAGSVTGTVCGRQGYTHVGDTFVEISSRRMFVTIGNIIKAIRLNCFILIVDTSSQSLHTISVSFCIFIFSQNHILQLQEIIKTLIHFLQFEGRAQVI